MLAWVSCLLHTEHKVLHSLKRSSCSLIWTVILSTPSRAASSSTRYVLGLECSILHAWQMDPVSLVGVTGAGWNCCHPDAVDPLVALVLLHLALSPLWLPGVQVMVYGCVYKTFKLSLCRYVNLPPGSMGIYDPTEIRNRGKLSGFQKEAFVKIAYHLVTFFIALYGSVCKIIMVVLCYQLP